MLERTEILTRPTINVASLQREYRLWLFIVLAQLGLISMLLLASLLMTLRQDLPETYLTTYAGQLIKIEAGVPHNVQN
jgi:hypothetical protein